MGKAVIVTGAIENTGGRAITVRANVCCKRTQGDIMVTGLNHITLAVSDIERSLDFYTRVPGFTGHVKWDRGAYLSAGDIWRCLSLDTPCAKEDYTHTAFSVNEADFAGFRARLTALETPEWNREQV